MKRILSVINFASTLILILIIVSISSGYVDYRVTVDENIFNEHFGTSTEFKMDKYLAKTLNEYYDFRLLDTALLKVESPIENNLNALTVSDTYSGKYFIHTITRFIQNGQFRTHLVLSREGTNRT